MYDNFYKGITDEFQLKIENAIDTINVENKFNLSKDIDREHNNAELTIIYQYLGASDSIINDELSPSKKINQLSELSKIRKSALENIKNSYKQFNDSYFKIMS